MFNMTTNHLSSEYTKPDVYICLLSVPLFSALCCSNQMTIIQELLTFLHRKHLRFYTNHYHALYTVQLVSKHVLSVSYS